MRKNIDNIEIQEPPIEELKKKSSCLKSTCFTGFGCVTIFIIGSLLLLKFSAGPQMEKLAKLPETFPSSIPVYSPDDITNITFVSGQEPNKIKEYLANIPKIVFYPILLTLENKNGNPPKEIFNRENFRQYLEQPKNENRDTYTIEWQEINASPSFIEKYYQTELEKNDYQINTQNNQEDNFIFSFSNNEITGDFKLTDTDNKKPTDYLVITIKTPHQ